MSGIAGDPFAHGVVTKLQGRLHVFPERKPPRFAESGLDVKIVVNTIRAPDYEHWNH